MSEPQSKTLTLADVAALEQLINSQESHFDPEHRPVGSAWPTDLLAGAFSDVDCRGVFDGEKLVAAVCLDFDENRQRVLVELFREPGREASLADLWRQVRRDVRGVHEGWLWWPTVNKLDYPLQEMLQESGLRATRNYHTMSAPVSGCELPSLPAGVEIRPVVAPHDHANWHLCHQESFKSHHGFKPRAMADWIGIVVNHDGYDEFGSFIAYVEGEPAGFVTCDNRLAHLGTGYINMLGVREQFQGRGLGELLLRWGLAYCAQRDYAHAELAVDTDNVTGALHLYEKVGFRAYAGFILFEGP